MQQNSGNRALSMKKGRGISYLHIIETIENERVVSEVDMVKPIELGLVLDQKESIRFQKYIDNPKSTDAGRRLIREAAELADKLHL